MKRNKKNLLRYEDGRMVQLDQDDAPELTASFFRQARPAKEVLEKIFGKKKANVLLSGKAKVKAIGRPRSASPKEQITLRLSKDVTEAIRSTGAGYNARVEAVLREAFIQG